MDALHIPFLFSLATPAYRHILHAHLSRAITWPPLALLATSWQCLWSTVSTFFSCRNLSA